MTPDNPFRVTKSNDLTDQQIEQLWVSVTQGHELTGLASPASATAMYVLGGKGSGKSHLLRYYSFPVQLLRYARSATTIADGIAADKFVGIYARCGGMDSSRFSGKQLSSETWSALFAYYFELWVADKTIEAILTLAEAGLVSPEVDAAIAKEIGSLLDKQQTHFASVCQAREFFADIRRNLDYVVNNAVFTNKIEPDVLVTRGKLFFGLPNVFCKNLALLKGVTFVYLLDEFENFSEERQVHVNTLIREREGPVAFRIGSRLYGRRTLKTLSGGERNLRDSEFEEVLLDEQFRRNPKKYKEFCLKLVSRRLYQNNDSRRLGTNDEQLHGFFETASIDWDSSGFEPDSRSSERPHLKNLRDKLHRGIAEELVDGARSTQDVSKIIQALTFPDHPILEKLCILWVFQRWFRSEDVSDAAHSVRERALKKLAGKEDKKFDEFVDKHKADMIAQWLRENGQKQIYAGLDTFISMSEGLPRALITILKHTFDWATYTGEDPFKLGKKISVSSQQRGVTKAADLFLEQMLPDGEDGVRVGTAIERLCALFRANRFADKPVETSLIAFSVEPLSLSGEARRLLDLASKTSLLIGVDGGQRERNSMSVTSKFEINRMLSPRRDLPIARRGVASFKTDIVEAIFASDQQEAFQELAKAWVDKMTAPAFGRTPSKRRRRSSSHPDFFA